MKYGLHWIHDPSHLLFVGLLEEEPTSTISSSSASPWKEHHLLFLGLLLLLLLIGMRSGGGVWGRESGIVSSFWSGSMNWRGLAISLFSLSSTASKLYSMVLIEASDRIRKKARVALNSTAKFVHNSESVGRNCAIAFSQWRSNHWSSFGSFPGINAYPEGVWHCRFRYILGYCTVWHTGSWS